MLTSTDENDQLRLREIVDHINVIIQITTGSFGQLDNNNNYNSLY